MFFYISYKELHNFHRKTILFIMPNDMSLSTLEHYRGEKGYMIIDLIIHL